MEIKCPQCGIKGEEVDNKCPICDCYLESTDSKPSNQKIFKIAILAIAVIALGFAYLYWKNHLSKDMTISDQDTLIGKRSDELSIFRFHLGMSRIDAEKILISSKDLVGVQNDNPQLSIYRIYVHEKLPSGGNGKTLLYLIWDKPEVKELKQITVFDDCRPYLKPNFSRLLTLEAIDNSSEFKKKFIGYPNRSENTEFLSMKTTTDYYDAIGIEVSHQRFRNNDLQNSVKEGVIFALVKK